MFGFWSPDAYLRIRAAGRESVAVPRRAYAKHPAFVPGKRLQKAPVVRVVHVHVSVVARGEHGFSVGREGHVSHALVVPFQFVKELARPDVKNRHHAVRGAAHQARPVVANRECHGEAPGAV